MGNKINMISVWDRSFIADVLKKMNPFYNLLISLERKLIIS